MEQTTKTRASLRTVALSEFAVAALLVWQLRQAQEAEAAAEAWQTQGHVFTMDDGQALDPSCVTRLFQRLSEGSGAAVAAPWEGHSAFRVRNYQSSASTA